MDNDYFDSSEDLSSSVDDTRLYSMSHSDKKEYFKRLLVYPDKSKISFIDKNDATTKNKEGAEF